MKHALLFILIMLCPIIAVSGTLVSSPVSLGDVEDDVTIHFQWRTNDGSGGSITRSTNGTIQVYRDNDAGSEITAGITDVEDFDAHTGLHACTIDLSASASYETGANYTVSIVGAVIDTRTVNAPIAYFSMQNRFDQVDMTRVSGDLTAANNMELQYDGTGLVGDTFPTTQSQFDTTADVVWDEPLTGATHNVPTSAGRRLRGIQDFQGYESGAIYINTINGTAGTTEFENGTVENPVDTLADATTLNNSLGFNKFIISASSTLTLAEAYDGFVFEGVNWTLLLGDQSISNSSIIGASVTGTSTGSMEVHFDHCHFGNATIPPSDLQHSILEGTITIGSAGSFFFEDCKSGVAGTNTPSLDFGAALNASDVNFRMWSGGILIQNMGAGSGDYNMSLEGFGQLIISANCSASSTIAIRGNFDITNNASGLTITQTANINSPNVRDAILADSTTFNGADIAAIPVDVDTELTSNHDAGSWAASSSVLNATAADFIDNPTTIGWHILTR